MKYRNPIDRNDLSIKKNDKVLEIGSGHNPLYRSNVLVDKFVDSDYHRSESIKRYTNQKFVHADGQNLPFKDQEFDYIVCNQVLEHVDDPHQFVEEISRVAKRGYIETPSYIGEYLFPKESHKWAILEIDNKLIMYDKALLKNRFSNFGTTFLNYLPYNSFALRLFYFSNHQAHTIRYEWKDKIDILVNPEQEDFKRYFFDEWDNDMIKSIFPKKNKIADIFMTCKVFAHFFSLYLIKKVRRRKLINVSKNDIIEMSSTH